MTGTNKKNKNKMAKFLQTKIKKIFSIITILALIMQVVLPGILFNFDVQKVKAAMNIIVNPSTIGINWDIGDSETITWITDVSIPDLQPDYFKLYYSEDSGSSWESIDDNVPYSSSPQDYIWDIPVVNGAGESDFQVKVESYLNSDPNTPTCTGTSLDFTIDYGPLDSLVVDAPPEMADNPEIDITITAKDIYSNTILNYNVTSMDWICTGGANATCLKLNKNFGSMTVTWNNGISLVDIPNDMQFDLTFPTEARVGQGSIQFISGVKAASDNVTWVAEIVIIDAPISASTWYTSNSENITFKSGGETTPDFLKIYYSHNSGSDWNLIDDNVTYGSQPQTYNWDIPGSVTNPGQQVFQIKVESHTTASGLITSGTSDSFIIIDGNPHDSSPIPEPIPIPPTSKVIGVLEDGLITSPLPDTIHQSEFTVKIGRAHV